LGRGREEKGESTLVERPGSYAFVKRKAAGGGGKAFRASSGMAHARRLERNLDVCARMRVRARSKKKESFIVEADTVERTRGGRIAGRKKSFLVGRLLYGETHSEMKEERPWGFPWKSSFDKNFGARKSPSGGTGRVFLGAKTRESVWQERPGPRLLKERRKERLRKIE